MTGWEALADAVRARRRELGLRQQDLRPLGGPSHESIRLFESGTEREYRRNTIAQLENALGWMPGAVRRIIDGIDDYGHVRPPTFDQPNTHHGDLDVREWRVGTHYGVHVYAVNPGPNRDDDEPIASFLGPPDVARARAQQMVREHAMLSTAFGWPASSNVAGTGSTSSRSNRGGRRR